MFGNEDKKPWNNVFVWAAIIIVLIVVVVGVGTIYSINKAKKNNNSNENSSQIEQRQDTEVGNEGNYSEPKTDEDSIIDQELRDTAPISDESSDSTDNSI